MVAYKWFSHSYSLNQYRKKMHPELQQKISVSGVSGLLQANNSHKLLFCIRGKYEVHSNYNRKANPTVILSFGGLAIQNNMCVQIKRKFWERHISIINYYLIFPCIFVCTIGVSEQLRCRQLRSLVRQPPSIRQCVDYGAVRLKDIAHLQHVFCDSSLLRFSLFL